SGAFSRDGKLILSVDWPEGVRVWNAVSGEELKFLQRTNASCGILSTDVQRLAVIDSGSVFILGTATGAQLAPPIPLTFSGSRKLAFSPDGTRLAVADAEKTRI